MGREGGRRMSCEDVRLGETLPVHTTHNSRCERDVRSPDPATSHTTDTMTSYGGGLEARITPSGRGCAVVIGLSTIAARGWLLCAWDAHAVCWMPGLGSSGLGRRACAASSCAFVDFRDV
eukprot:scaffold20210_cov113-Isochrysis_galbana.AAC.5